MENNTQNASHENGWYFLKQIPKLPWNKQANKSTKNADAILTSIPPPLRHIFVFADAVFFVYR